MLGFMIPGARMMGGYYGFGGRLFGIGHALFGLFVLSVVIGLLVWAATRRRHAHMASVAPASPYATHAAPSVVAGDDEAMRIARERLARGEIDAEQYSAIVQALRG